MPRFRRLGPGAVRTKSGPLDLVTEADEAAERYISAALLALFPGAVVIGEEAAFADPTLLERIATAPLAFLIDPLDGTSNYIARLPLFGVMAAAVEEGRVKAGVILDPIGDDWAIAIRGEGAWIEGPEGRRQVLRVAAPTGPSAMTGSLSWRFLPEPQRSAVCARLARVGPCWEYRCAAHQYRMVAGGYCHFAIYSRLMPWDHAAGWLLHREAGGFSARFDASAYRPTVTDGGLICAPDEASWWALRATLFEP